MIQINHDSDEFRNLLALHEDDGSDEDWSPEDRS